MPAVGWLLPSGDNGGDVVDLSHPPAAKGDEDNNEECQERKSSANLWWAHSYNDDDYGDDENDDDVPTTSVVPEPPKFSIRELSTVSFVIFAQSQSQSQTSAIQNWFSHHFEYNIKKIYLENWNSLILSKKNVNLKEKR